MAVVAFNPEEFKGLYPQLADFTDAQLQNYFDVACLVVNNTERSMVPYNPPGVTTRKTILYLLVCHQCELSLRRGVVGILTSVSQGSVSAGFAAPTNPGAEWFNQSQCGATAWQILQGFMHGGRLYNGCFR